jgi:hypothetical protein
MNAVKNPGPGAPRFTPDNPIPQTEATSKVISSSSTQTLVKK